MKKVLSFLGRCRFLIILLVFFIGADILLGTFFGSYIVESGNFWLDDYEITRRDNPEAVWDKVFYGNSTVIAAYRDELSDSAYINFGVDYGSATGLLAILESGEVEIGSELVIGLNWASMCDAMETNPTYFWNRGTLEPYSYFQRDRLYKALTGALWSRISGNPWADGSYVAQTKSYYYSCLSEAELAEKVAVYEERYWAAGIEGYSQNLEALQRVITLCGDKGIGVRVVMMPWNPSVEKPELISELDRAIIDICSRNGIEYLDLSDTFDFECFYDLGHLNYEYGSHMFTEVIDEWINS